MLEVQYSKYCICRLPTYFHRESAKIVKGPYLIIYVV